MRFPLWQTFFLAASTVLPFGGQAAPCLGRRCDTSLIVREAEPGFPFIPIPKPVPAFPKPPFTPTFPNIPNVPKPVPKPNPKPKPEPAPKPVPAPVCRRAGECSSPLAKDSKEETLRAKGEQSQKSLDDVIAASPPQADKDLVPIKEHYDSHKDLNDPPYFDEPDYNFIRIIPEGPQIIETGWVRQDVVMKGAKSENGLSPPMVLETYGSSEMKSMVISESKNKELDPKPALRWSDMVMDHWKTVAGSNAKDLHYMIRSNIRTDRTTSDMDTMSAVDLAVARAGTKGADVSTVKTFRRISEGDEKINYQLIAGTPHGDRVLKMLGDYHGGMGNLNIAAFHVYKPGMRDGPNGGTEYAIIIEFGR